MKSVTYAEHDGETFKEVSFILRDDNFILVKGSIDNQVHSKILLTRETAMKLVDFILKCDEEL